nr:unnamed protein product [Callosobruchus analis]CAI5857602.1 unnamed protein product [Callosobruchus analis]
MKYYAAGDGLLNSAINNLPFEMHIPGYSWCGPGTKVKKRLARNDPGVNGLDEACKEHDILYANESDLTKRHAADEVLARKAMKRFSSKDASWKEKIAALGVAGAMKAKVKLGMGVRVQNRTKDVDAGKKHLLSVHKRCVKKLQKVQLELGTAIEQMKDSLQVVQEKDARQNKQQSTQPRQQQQQEQRKQCRRRRTQGKEQVIKEVQKIKKNNATRGQRRRAKGNQRQSRMCKNKKNKEKEDDNVSLTNDDDGDDAMSVDIADDYPMTRIHRKRKLDSTIESDISDSNPNKRPRQQLKAKRKRTNKDDDDDDDGYRKKQRKVDLNEPIIIPPERKRKRKHHNGSVNHDDDDASDTEKPPAKIPNINS